MLFQPIAATFATPVGSGRDGPAREARAHDVRVAPGVGHLLPLEAMEWVNAHIARFITTRLKELRPAA